MKVGSTVSIPRQNSESEKGHLKKIPTILFEDPNIIVLSKPAGLLSQGEITGDENLVDWLRGYLGRPYVGLIHRLDRNTSGIMLVAKRTKAAQRLTHDLQNDKINRTYLAWVIGNLKSPARWKHFLRKNTRTNVVEIVKDREGREQGHVGAKESSLRAIPQQHQKWKSLEVTLVEFQLETGRSHQIRVQSAEEGFPLLGDRKYGAANERSGLSKSEVNFPRVALHSFSLSFFHPISKELMKFEDPLPKDLLL